MSRLKNGCPSVEHHSCQEKDPNKGNPCILSCWNVVQSRPFLWRPKYLDIVKNAPNLKFTQCKKYLKGLKRDSPCKMSSNRAGGGGRCWACPCAPAPHSQRRPLLALLGTAAPSPQPRADGATHCLRHLANDRKF